jgi:hypothetical protein
MMQGRDPGTSARRNTPEAPARVVPVTNPATCRAVTGSSTPLQAHGQRHEQGGRTLSPATGPDYLDQARICNMTGDKASKVRPEYGSA